MIIQRGARASGKSVVVVLRPVFGRCVMARRLYIDTNTASALYTLKLSASVLSVVYIIIIIILLFITKRNKLQEGENVQKNHNKSYYCFFSIVRSVITTNGWLVERTRVSCTHVGTHTHINIRNIIKR